MKSTVAKVYWSLERSSGQSFSYRMLVRVTFEQLASECEKAYKMLKEYQEKCGNAQPAIDLIMAQIDFVRACAKVNIDPLQVAIDQRKPFNFGIVSSRLFASPEELVIKKQLDTVSDGVDEIHQNIKKFKI